MDNIIKLNITKKYALMEDGTTLPIVHFAGDEVDCDPAEAYHCVVGPTKDGQWIVVEIKPESIEIITLH